MNVDFTQNTAYTFKVVLKQDLSQGAICLAFMCREAQNLTQENRQ